MMLRYAREACKFGMAHHRSHRQVHAMPRFPHQIFRASKFGRSSKGYATRAASRVPFPVSVRKREGEVLDEWMMVAALYVSISFFF
uniref:Uncharacterized protein n=1 Tax=Setaria viridis TaxID=4556 RepID=A0A4U6USF8_SETVI|nr:hypothetical protein SEVIR_5G135850v2 [Setaria viridis]